MNKEIEKEILKSNKENGIWKAFNELYNEKNAFDIIGKKIPLGKNGNLTNVSLLALRKACDIYRNKDYETFRFILINKEGYIKEQCTTTSFCNSKAQIPLEHTLNALALAQKYDYKIVLAHNHPSGNIKPSIEDIETTKKLKKIFNINNNKYFAGHIILDHTKCALTKNGEKWTVHNINIKETDPFIKEKNIAENISNQDILINIAEKINDNNSWNDNYIPLVIYSHVIKGIKLIEKNELLNNKKIDEDIKRQTNDLYANFAALIISPQLINKLSEEENFKLINKCIDLQKSKKITDCIYGEGPLSEICNELPFEEINNSELKERYNEKTRQIPESELNNLYKKIENQLKEIFNSESNKISYNKEENEIQNIEHKTSWRYVNSNKISVNLYDVKISEKLFKKLSPVNINDNEIPCIEYRKSTKGKEFDQYLITKLDKKTKKTTYEKTIEINEDLQKKINDSIKNEKLQIKEKEKGRAEELIIKK